ncbi:cyclin-A3-2-like isoform X2 [Phragmites australis]|uniref:cyclin-A3-2-like isoform X2 n=1 Tax=Phragmites australis TaxID=29695 RepID=UPI002D776323|nr:cyclin-A3-2-like isoform X2 [Phragmites australis]
MADKENAAPAAAAGPRLTRAAAKRAAGAAAGGAAKRKRVALGELPALSNAGVLRAPSQPVKPSKSAARPGKAARRSAGEARQPAAAAAADADRSASSSPPRAAAAETDPDSSASSSRPRAAAADADLSASSSPPRAAGAAASGAAKRKRVALGELPTLPNAGVLRAPSHPVKPSKSAARPGKAARRSAGEARKPAASSATVADADRSASSSPPRAAAAETDPYSSASSSRPRAAAADADRSASSSPPRAAAAETDPDSSASSSRPRAAAADADLSASSSPPRAAAADADPDSSASSSRPRAVATAADAPPRAAATQLCGAYASDIYTYLRSLEVEPRRRPRADYIEAVQADVTANMRTILVDWLVEVAEEYKLVADTLYLAISYIDRFLSANALSRDKLQLLGVTAMLIAAKYEEIGPPHVEDFCYITDNTYTKQELVKMESDILKLLEFELGNPTIKTFLRRFTRAAHEDRKRSILLLEFLGSYLAELSLLDYGCLRFLPSVVAASVVFVARLTIDPDTNPWSKKLLKVTGYNVSELKDCIIAIHDLQLNRKCSSLTAIQDKYKQHKFKCVSMLLPPVVIPTSYFKDLTE